MVVTLQQILRPLFLTCFIMGLGFYPKKQSKIRWIAHSIYILYSLTIWFACVYLFFYMSTHFTRKTLIDSAIMEIAEESYFLLSFIYVIMSFYHQKRFEASIKRLAVVDDTLEKLGTPKMYKKLHIRSKQVIIGWIVYTLTLNFIDTLWWLSLEGTASFGLYIAHIANHGFHINVFVDVLFIFFLWYIGTRFDKISEHIRCLLVNQNHILRYTWKNSVTAIHRYALYINYKHTLWISMHLYLELCRLARELNFIFAVQMTFEMACYLSYLTTLFYYLYWMLIQKHREEIYSIYDWFSIICWIFVLLMRIYIINYICENVTQKANEIGKLFHQMLCNHRYADVRKEVYLFTLQTIHHPLKFTGMGLFYFGHEFFQKFCMAILMYVIIMVQFKISIIH